MAVQVRLGASWECEEVGVGLTAVGPTAIKARKAEQWMKGKKGNDGSAIREFGRLAAEESRPAADIRGTAAYKKQVVRLLVTRAFKTACERAGGGL